MIKDLEKLDMYRRKIKRLQEQLKELETGKYNIGSSSGRDSPGGRSRRSTAYFERRLEKQELLTNKLREVIAEYMLLKMKVCEQIEMLADERYKNVLFYRYILGLSMAEVARKMGKAVTWVYDLKQQALKEYERYFSEQHGEDLTGSDMATAELSLYYRIKHGLNITP